MTTKYMILGGGGSFGIHTAMYILENFKDTTVIGVGRNPLRSEPFSLRIDQRPGFQYFPRHIHYEFDLFMELLDKEKPDIIINFAAQGEGAVSWKNSWRFFETNTVALSKLTEELTTRKWLKKFIQIGTSEMYGSVNHAVSEDEPIKPSSPYAASKVAFDLYLVSISKTLNFPMNIIRPSNAYCPGQLLHRVIPRTIWCGLTGNKLPLQGGGKAKKSYIHARDLAKAITLVANSAPNGEIYNVGPKFPTSILEVVNRTANAIGTPISQLCDIVEDRIGQDSQYWLDSSKIKNELGWEPLINWDEGLKEMAEWGITYFDKIKNYSPEYVMRG